MTTLGCEAGLAKVLEEVYECASAPIRKTGSDRRKSKRGSQGARANALRQMDLFNAMDLSGDSADCVHGKLILSYGKTHPISIVVSC